MGGSPGSVPTVPGNQMPASVSTLRWQDRLLAILLIAGAALLCLAPLAAAQAPPSAGATSLPVVELDAIDPSAWSQDTLTVAPGQTIRITNRGVLPHRFVVPDWGVAIDLPTLQSQEVVVPDSVSPGETFTFLCDEPGHAEAGMTGTITVVAVEDLATQGPPVSGDTPDVRAATLQANDSFTWTPASLELEPGQILQVLNSGIIEHHFVVDEWGINETISAGETVLVRVPADLQPGATFTFYCSVPGHRAAGMEGTITIVAATGQSQPPSEGGATGGIREADVRQFVPDAEMLGEGWSEVRSGNVRSIMPEWSEINVSVFPGDGIGSVFVGPAGSRIAVAVLPLVTTSVPSNQVQQAIDDVQFALMQNWNTNASTSLNLQALPPPVGCSVAQRAMGVTGLHTLPAGLTVCQVRNANIAMFVTIEGEIDSLSGVEASDQVVERVLERFGTAATGTGVSSVITSALRYRRE